MKTRTDRSDAGVDPLYATLRSTSRFVWEHLPSVIAISFGWFLGVLPIVTIGPATVGAYRAIFSLREHGRIERRDITSVVRTRFAHATLIGLIPVVLLVIAVMYTLAYLSTGRLFAGLLALAVFNAGIYAWLVSVPTLLWLADGESPTNALTEGYLWTARHTVGAIALGVVTAVVFAVTALFTVAVAVLFAGVTFAFHAEFVIGSDSTGASEARPSLSRSPRSQQQQ